jgi:carbamoyl-phosphate synthase large subunit
LGTPPDAIDRAEDRERFCRLVTQLNLLQPANRTVRTLNEGIESAHQIGYPLVVRPSYVLGGRAMEIVYNESELKNYLLHAVSVSNDSPVLLDRFLDDAIEVDVDAVCDGERVLIGGIMEHIEQAGVHSGDSACSLPPHSISPSLQARIKDQMEKMAFELGVRGLMNAQFAIKGDDIYILEVNPRASRTVPFVAKATGVPLAQIAAKCMVGIKLIDQPSAVYVTPPYYSVKAPVFPFEKFLGVDPILGPEMKSTGEVMGVGKNFAQAYAKSQLATGNQLIAGGKAFISVRDADKVKLIDLGRQLAAQGFELVGTRGTANALTASGVPCTIVNKVMEGRPHIVDMIKNGEIDFIVNTTEGKQAIADSFTIRRTALQRKIKYTTTLAAGFACASAFAYPDLWDVNSLQQLHK